MTIKNLLLMGFTFFLTLTISASVHKTQKSSIYKYEVTHNHRMGSCKGELYFTEQNVEYRSTNRNTTHCYIWQYSEVKNFDISQNKIKIGVYQKNTSPSSNTLGTSKTTTLEKNYEQYEFIVLKQEVGSDLLNFLTTNFHKPITTSVIPNDKSKFGSVIYETPVFYMDKSKGTYGTLFFYEYSIVFQSEVTNQSKYWKYSDIHNINRIGDYQLEISTYDTLTESKNYLFDLKKIISTPEYDMIRIKLYGKTPIR